MTIESLLLLLLLIGISGAVGQLIAGYDRIGFLTSIIVGFIGALLGRWLMGVLGLPEIFSVNIGGQSFPVIWSILGAALFGAVLSFFTYRRVYF